MVYCEWRIIYFLALWIGRKGDTMKKIYAYEKVTVDCTHATGYYYDSYVDTDLTVLANRKDYLYYDEVYRKANKSYYNNTLDWDGIINQLTKLAVWSISRGNYGEVSLTCFEIVHSGYTDQIVDDFRGEVAVMVYDSIGKYPKLHPQPVEKTCLVIDGELTATKYDYPSITINDRDCSLISLAKGVILRYLASQRGIRYNVPIDTVTSYQDGGESQLVGTDRNVITTLSGELAYSLNGDKFTEERYLAIMDKIAQNYPKIADDCWLVSQSMIFGHATLEDIATDTGLTVNRVTYIRRKLKEIVESEYQLVNVSNIKVETSTRDYVPEDKPPVKVVSEDGKKFIIHPRLKEVNIPCFTWKRVNRLSVAVFDSYTQKKMYRIIYTDKVTGEIVYKADKTQPKYWNYYRDKNATNNNVWCTRYTYSQTGHSFKFWFSGDCKQKTIPLASPHGQTLSAKRVIDARKSDNERLLKQIDELEIYMPILIDSADISTMPSWRVRDGLERKLRQLKIDVGLIQPEKRTPKEIKIQRIFPTEGEKRFMEKEKDRIQALTLRDAPKQIITTDKKGFKHLTTII